MHVWLPGLIKLIISYPYVRAVDRETFRRGEVSVISLAVRFFVSSRSALLALYLFIYLFVHPQSEISEWGGTLRGESKNGCEGD